VRLSECFVHCVSDLASHAGQHVAIGVEGDGDGGVSTIFPSWQTFSGVQFVAMFALLSTPVFTYIAILKYRLYEIDILINRTLVYGALTAILVLIYFAGVAASEAMFRAVTGQEQPWSSPP
jgi:hypothetical protein